MRTPLLSILAVVAGGFVSCHAVAPQVEDRHIEDAAPVDVTPECFAGETRCSGDQFEVCSSGTYAAVMQCEQRCEPDLGCTDEPTDLPLSYIWIANSGEGTLSKIDTRTAVEIARYRTCPHGWDCDPSRTSVNLHGDVVVTNRMASPSSVTKFAANLDDCVDRNSNGIIDTSSHPSAIYPWGEDECMLWHTELPPEPLLQHETGSHGARATAWDGNADSHTGQGGHVWVGTCMCSEPFVAYAYELDGDTGAIEERVVLDGRRCLLGAAADGTGGIWFFDNSCSTLVRLDSATLQTTIVDVDCGYGITIDPLGRIWTGGGDATLSSCVSRYDPVTGNEDVLTVAGSDFLRGIAVGTAKSDGFVWAADTPGTLYQIDASALEVVGAYSLGTGIELIGVAIDYQGFVWTVAKAACEAYKYDPDTDTHVTVPVGVLPHTYSDMTGTQLRNVVGVD